MIAKMTQVEIQHVMMAISFVFIVFAVVVSWKSNKIYTQILSICMIITALWVTDISMSYYLSNDYTDKFLTKLDHLMGLLISLGICFFSNKVSGLKNNKVFYVIFVSNLLIGILILFTDFLIKDSYRNISALHNYWQYGNLIIPYLFLFITNLAYSISKIYYSSLNLNKITKYILIFSIILGFVPPIISCILLPYFGYYSLVWMGPISIIIWILIITYGIIRHSLFNIRIFIFEILIFIIWTSIFLHSVVIKNTEYLISELILFFIIIILSILFLATNRDKERYERIISETVESLKRIDKKLFNDNVDNN
jgi:hypothetical protein